MVFREVLENFARVDRILTVPGGSVMLAGRSGVGRRTAVQLIAHMHQMVLFTPKMTRNYGLKQFKTDLKTVSFTGFVSQPYRSDNRFYIKIFYLKCFVQLYSYNLC